MRPRFAFLVAGVAALLLATACRRTQAPELTMVSPLASPTLPFISPVQSPSRLVPTDDGRLPTAPTSSTLGFTSPVQAPSRLAPGDDGRLRTALASYQPAEGRAKMWDPQAVLYGVAPSRTMERNLGLPPSTPGWFFKFGVVGSPLEFYVQVIDGQVSGFTEAQPILVEPLPYEELPINIRTIKIDSFDALELLRQERGDDLQGLKPDYRLIHLKGTANPVWSLFDQDTPGTPLINVDAITGHTVADPMSAAPGR